MCIFKDAAIIKYTWQILTENFHEYETNMMISGK